jgi:hypothetical protein
MSTGHPGGYRIRRGEQKSNAESRLPFRSTCRVSLGLCLCAVEIRGSRFVQCPSQTRRVNVLASFKPSRSQDQAHTGSLRDERGCGNSVYHAIRVAVVIV